MVETREVDGRRCLIIAIDGDVEVNGILLRENLANGSPEKEGLD